MKKIVRKSLKYCCFSCLLILGVFFTYHRFQLAQEQPLVSRPIGRLVEVDGLKMNVYVAGQGQKTLVFLSGGGTASPVLDFKSLYSRLEQDYRIVVVERLGYGFSDNSKGDSRDVDTVLSQTRQALNEADIAGPYVILAHSMSGLEALHWAANYPAEVKGIIGLDMALPSSYADLKLYPSIYKILQVAADLGLSRISYSVDKNIPAIQAGDLTREEKQVYKAIFYRRPLSDAVIDEVKQVQQNAQIVSGDNLPQIPILLFSSNGQGTGYSQEKWQSFQEDFAAQYVQTELVRLDCPHYVHDYASHRIAEKIKDFIR